MKKIYFQMRRKFKTYMIIKEDKNKGKNLKLKT